MSLGRKDGRMVVVTGSSRSGKTYWVMNQNRAARRVIVWDIKGEWGRGAFQSVSGIGQLVTLIRDLPGPARIAYRPQALSDFNQFCRAAWAWGKLAPCTIVAEELADVTNPGKAPQWWGMLCRQGLGYGIDIYAITQRPAESDKTAIGNATAIHTHRLARAADRRYMAAELDVDQSEVDRLLPGQWVEREAGRPLRRGGKILKN